MKTLGIESGNCWLDHDIIGSTLRTSNYKWCNRNIKKQSWVSFFWARFVGHYSSSPDPSSKLFMQKWRNKNKMKSCCSKWNEKKLLSNSVWVRLSINLFQFFSHFIPCFSIIISNTSRAVVCVFFYILFSLHKFACEEKC